MTELMSSGIELMFAGMGIVFLFLTMLVVVINVMSGLIQRYLPEEPTLSISIPVSQSTATDKNYIAAITAAVHQYRSTH
ncbi:MAG: OadG family transporter subunit [Methylococcales bacterium]|jgi:oxaloacetate decarboxylase gamma subunit|nr:OadG family transporter subunit [Methylococcales bacterium]MDD5754014.1 OadG family transporter subunit [Methylococcales bacterium]